MLIDLIASIYQEATEYINSGIEFNTKTEKIEDQSVIYVDMGAASKYVKEAMDKKYGPAEQKMIKFWIEKLQELRTVETGFD